MGSGTTVKWPAGEAEKGSEGVSGRIRRTPGSIGYVELAYALQNNLAYGSVRNASGAFIRADMKSVTAAAAGAEMPSDFRISITNAPRADAYPISSFTWLLIPDPVADPPRKKALLALLRDSDKGQTECATLGYIQLQDRSLRKRNAAARFDSIASNSQNTVGQYCENPNSLI